MTDDMMALRTLLEKGSDASLLREMIGFAARRLMELESARYVTLETSAPLSHDKTIMLPIAAA